MLIPNLCKAHFKTNGASRPFLELEVLIVREHLDGLLHGAIYNVHERYRVVGQKLIELVLLTVPNLDMQPLLLELKIRSIINGLNGSF